MNYRLASSPRTMLNKVPEVTVYFWVIKVLCTTVGETAADYLNVNLDLGLTGVSVITGLLLLGALIVQFRSDRYRPGRYWLTVAIVSVFGTLITDNLTDNLGVPLETSTLVFGALLAATFLLWYRSERTLSIHSIVTTRRETFYWAAILFTFALGTATGDLMAQVLGLGYLPTGLIVTGLIAVTAVAWRLGLHPVLAFWFSYVLTRPLGASIGDYLSQPVDEGGLGLGATVTSLIFTVAILATVGYLLAGKADVTTSADHGVALGDAATDRHQHGGLQTVVFLGAVLLACGVGYVARVSTLRADTVVAVAPNPTGLGTPSRPAGAPPVAPPRTPLGDLSAFRRITQDTLTRLDNGDQNGATSRVDDLESAWDKAQATLKPRDDTAWTEIDGKIDTVLREVRSTSTNQATEKTALQALLDALR